MSSELDQLYQQVILDHARARHGYGLVEHADAQQHGINPTCGDEVTLQVVLTPDGEGIAEVHWAGEGCSISQASASVLAQTVPGRTVAEAEALIDAFRAMMHSRGSGEPDEGLLGDAVAFHGASRYVMRVKCAMLPWIALEGCLRPARADRE